LLLEDVSHSGQILLFHPSEKTILGVLTLFILVSRRYLLIRSTSPKNHPSSFPPLLTALVFILLADGGVPTIAQFKEYLWHTAEKLRIEEKKEQQVVCVKNQQLIALFI